MSYVFEVFNDLKYEYTKLILERKPILSRTSIHLILQNFIFHSFHSFFIYFISIQVMLFLLRMLVFDKSNFF